MGIERVLPRGNHAVSAAMWYRQVGGRDGLGESLGESLSESLSDGLSDGLWVKV